MSKRHDVYEERCIASLQVWIEVSRANRDALPGSVVKLLKQAAVILKKRRPPRS